MSRSTLLRTAAMMVAGAGFLLVFSRPFSNDDKINPSLGTAGGAREEPPKASSKAGAIDPSKKDSIDSSEKDGTSRDGDEVGPKTNEIEDGQNDNNKEADSTPEDSNPAEEEACAKGQKNENEAGKNDKGEDGWPPNDSEKFSTNNMASILAQRKSTLTYEKLEQMVKSYKQEIKAVRKKNKELEAELALLKIKPVSGLEKGVTKAVRRVLDDGKDESSVVSSRSFFGLGEGNNAKAFAVSNILLGGQSSLKVLAVAEATAAKAQVELDSLQNEAVLHAKAAQKCPSYVVGMYSVLLLGPAPTSQLTDVYSGRSLVEALNTPAKSRRNLEAQSPPGSQTPGRAMDVPDTIQEEQSQKPSPLGKNSPVDDVQHKGLLILNMQLCEHGDLSNLVQRITELRESGKIPFSLGFQLALSPVLRVVDGVQHLHSNEILHKDVQARNVFLTSVGGEDSFDSIIALIGDFGASISKKEDVDNNGVALDFRGLGHILFEICAELLSNDDQEYETWFSQVGDKIQKPGGKVLLPNEWDKRLTGKDKEHTTVGWFEEIKSLILMSTQHDKSEHPPFDVFTAALENLKSTMEKNAENSEKYQSVLKDALGEWRGKNAE